MPWCATSSPGGLPPPLDIRHSCSPIAIGAAPIPAISGVYLIHLDEPYFHARHYVGYADDVGRVHTAS